MCSGISDVEVAEHKVAALFCRRQSRVKGGGSECIPLLSVNFTLWSDDDVAPVRPLACCPPLVFWIVSSTTLQM